jgi:CubicO group peptidase (beta-lactamase class C family)
MPAMPLDTPYPADLADAIHHALAHEVAWPRDPDADPAHWGVHHDDPPPWNRLRGPVHVRGGVSGVVWQHGQELAAWGDPARSDQTFSVAKTYLALLAGVAQLRGLLPDLEAPVVSLLPGIGFDSPHNRHITWAHLLAQTSEWEGSCLGMPDMVERYRKVSHDPRPPGGRKGEARPLQAPGSYWEYNDVRINQLSLALLHLFGRPLPEVFDEAIRGPIGAADPWCWEAYDDAWVTVAGQRLPSVPGGTHWGGGVSISARDQARVGQLLLDGGVHRGQRLLDAQFVASLGRPCPIAPFYGRLVWLNPGAAVFPGASARAVLMVGAGGHYVWIDPELQAVVVVRWLDGAHAGGFMQRMGTALRKRLR